MTDKNALFAVRPTDARPVSSALAAADRAWKRGDRADALRWVQRATVAASDADDDRRAAELAKCAAELAGQLGAAVMQGPPPLPVAAATSSSVHLLTKAKAPRTHVSPVRTDEPDAGARLPDFQDDETRQVSVVQLGAEGARKKAPSRPDKHPPPKRSGRTEEIEEWEPETLSRPDLSSVLAGVRAVPGRRLPVRPIQALRVRVWREPDGRLSVTPAGAPAPEHAVDAMLTALDPDTDLTALVDE